MKCVCGYEQRSGCDSNGDWKDSLVGDEPFIRLRGVILETDPESCYDEPDRVTLYVCPKCRTVQAEM